MTELFSSLSLAMESAKQISEIHQKQIFIYVTPDSSFAFVISDQYSSKPIRPSYQFLNGRML